MDQIFTFLFKYRPAAFSRGELAFDPPGPWWLVVATALVAAALSAWLYTRARRLAVRDRAALAILRTATLAVLVTCLAGPVLLIATAVPRRNVLAVLVDDSRSMGIRDGGDTTRFGAALASFAPETGRLARALGERFQVRVFRFSEMLSPLNAADTAGAAGRQTDLAAALAQARDRFAGEPLAGVVVASDGGDNAGGALTEALLAYRAAGVPIHAVGYGAERFDRDVSVDVVSLPERALKQTTVVAEVRIEHRGFAGQRIEVIVEDEGAIVGRSGVELGGEGAAITVPVAFTLTEAGARRLRVRVPVLRNERVEANNARDALVRVEDARRRILYFEGEPRFELRFIRAALKDERQLRVTTLLRTANEKFLRLDVEDSTEVAAGFPKSRAELFAYRGLILGSIEASFFTRDQLAMIAEFVRERGGGLLALGGRRGLAAGGYAGTPLAEALPVVLPRGDTSFFREVRVRPTPAGQRHPALRLDSSATAGGGAGRRWDSLPALSLTHAITAVKPGATALLHGEAAGGPYVVLAAQRYGRGRAVAFTVQDAWIWQMHASMSLEDQTHETLWKQLLRSLVADVPEQVTVHPAAAVVLGGRPVPLRAQVLDSAYLALNGAEVTATVRAPDGTERAVPLPWSIEQDGEYRGTFTPVADGNYEIVVDARHSGKLVGSAQAVVRAGDPRLEFAESERRTALLQRLASETGGHYYDGASANGLVDDVRYTSSGATTNERLDLWDMPAILLVLVMLIGAEWGYRRVRGLA